MSGYGDRDGYGGDSRGGYSGGGGGDRYHGACPSRAKGLLMAFPPRPLLTPYAPPPPFPADRGSSGYNGGGGGGYGGECGCDV